MRLFPIAVLVLLSNCCITFSTIKADSSVMLQQAVRVFESLGAR